MATDRRSVDATCARRFVAVFLLLAYASCMTGTAEIKQVKLEASANVAALQNRIEAGEINVPISYKGVGFWNLILIFGFLCMMKSIPSKSYRAALRPDRLLRNMLVRNRETQAVNPRARPEAQSQGDEGSGDGS